MDHTGEDELFYLPISDELDLHTFQPSDVKDLVNDYINECHNKGIYRVRIIHGKGKSVLKHIVHKQLAKNPLVENFHDAGSGSGGWGATIAYLKESKDPE